MKESQRNKTLQQPFETSTHNVSSYYNRITFKDVIPMLENIEKKLEQIYDIYDFQVGYWDAILDSKQILKEETQLRDVMWIIRDLIQKTKNRLSTTSNNNIETRNQLRGQISGFSTALELVQGLGLAE